MADLDQIERALRAADADGNTEDARRLAEAYQSAKASQPQAPLGQAQKPNAFVDSIRSVPGGLAQGAAAIAGLPGDVNELLDTGANWAMSKMTGKPVNVSTRSLPTSGDINKAIAEPFGGYYQPKTREGKQTESVARFALSALSPGSAIARFGRAAVPGVLSEDARQAAEGTPWEPLAAAGGALAGGIGMGMAEGVALARGAPKVPSLDELRKMKTATYKTAEQQGVVIAPQSVQKFAVDISDDLLKNNVVSDKLHPQTLAALDSIRAEAAKNAPMSLERADILRQEVTGAFENASSRDARLLSKVKAGLDDFLDNISPGDTISGDAAVAVPILKEARSLAQREFKAAEIQKLIDLAENSASTNYSASGLEQALRVQFKNFNAKLIKDPQLARSFTNAERAAIEKVARGGAAGNALRFFGKWNPSGPVSAGAGAGLGTAVGLATGSPYLGVGTALGIAGMGGAARQGATISTMGNAQRAGELMRGGMMFQGQPQPNSAVLLTDLLLSQAAHR